MNILITGSNGQLGMEFQRILSKGENSLGKVPKLYDDAIFKSVDINELNICDYNAVESFFEEQSFDLIINCAAMTNVDACESSPEKAMQVNAIGARNMAIIAGRSESNPKLVHISTDYVFPGTAQTPYVEWDMCRPNTIYGKSKLLGEQYVREAYPRSFIVRTAWLYGVTGNNFVKTILKIANEKKSLKVVSDQQGNPTNAADLAYNILRIVETEVYGIYHCSGNGICSWYDFACEIVRLFGIPCDVSPCTTSEYPRPAPRPAYSALDNLMLRCTTGDKMRDWKDALACFADYLKREGTYL